MAVKQELMSEDSNTFESSFYASQANDPSDVLSPSGVTGPASFNSSLSHTQATSSSLLNVKKEKMEDGEECHESSEDDKQSQGTEISDSGETTQSQRKEIQEEEEELRRVEREKKMEQQRYYYYYYYVHLLFP